jgi:hypothetical protein
MEEIREVESHTSFKKPNGFLAPKKAQLPCHLKCPVTARVVKFTMVRLFFFPLFSSSNPRWISKIQSCSPVFFFQLWLSFF